MFTISEIIQAVGGELIQHGKTTSVSGVSTDSRSVKSAELFIAIVGEKHDAHSFIKEVVKRGVKTLLVSKPVKVPSSVNVIQVEDTTKALGYLATAYRRRFNIPIVAITGSAGKTTTKEILAAVLGQKFNTLKSEKSLNNQFGVPLTLFRLNKSHQAAVLELGTNHPGEIAWLAHIAQPTICIFINIGDSHLEGLKSRAGVYIEKTQMIKFMPQPGVVIYNEDDVFLRRLKKMAMPHKKIGYSIKNTSAFRASDIHYDKNTMTFRVSGKKLSFPHPGQHLIYNILASISCARTLKVGFPAIARGLNKVNNVGGRQEISTIKGCTIINDSYNANPISYDSALHTLTNLPTKGRRILICGDMLELGASAKVKHEAVVKKAVALKIDVILATGKWMRYGVKAIPKSTQSIVIKHFPELSQLLNFLDEVNVQRDVILIKGSRGMRMERIIDHLKKVKERP